MPTDTHVGTYGYARRPQGNGAAETASTQNQKLIDISIGNGVDAATTAAAAATAAANAAATDSSLVASSQDYPTNTKEWCRRQEENFLCQKTERPL